MTTPGGPTAADVVRRASVVICCGSGGVGKTTAAAAFGLEAARLGRRACVVTIDPAKRLADALGLESLTDDPGPVAGDWPGELWALMLDTKSTFDTLVLRYSPTPEQARAILDNRLYRNVSAALSGTQEYMAMEKLYELVEDGGYDIVVVDTPPTRNALDFLDAPRRLIRFLDNRLFRVLMTPTKAYLRALGMATEAVLGTISRVVGAEVVNDAIAFFRAFSGMEDGFRARAAQVQRLLADAGTAFVLVTSPRREAVQEATYFADRLGDTGIDVDALVVNRVHPSFGDSPVPIGLGDLSRNLAELRAVSARERLQVESLAARVAPAAVAEVPVLAGDVHDVDTLSAVGRHLFGAGGTGGG